MRIGIVSGVRAELAGRMIEIRDGRRTRTYTLVATNDLARRVEDGPLLETERQGRLGIIRINNSLGTIG
ncbi:hypothetical protein NPJ82_17220 (plasmid) [Sphingomonas sp. NY01]|uniref:hypothetical protein n=1 Tax=Sphingomonas sp. NY01 TaxID=2968057 RepID=UPI00315C5839